MGANDQRGSASSEQWHLVDCAQTKIDAPQHSESAAAPSPAACEMTESERSTNGASKHVMVQAGSDASTVTLGSAIAELSLHTDLNDGGMAILAAATTLRDTTARV